MSKKIRCFTAFAVSCIVAFVVISLLPVNGEEKVYENVIRLHVIANSDSEEDQSLKLAVRDALLKKISAEKAETKSEAISYIEAENDEIISLCNSTLQSLGCEDSVTLELGREYYPVRYYDSFKLPAGNYTSLRVVIGNGEGHNWWCVLYPPLCTAASEAECEEEYLAAGFTGEEYKLIKKDSGVKYKVKFKFLEILSDAFGFDY